MLSASWEFLQQYRSVAAQLSLTDITMEWNSGGSETFTQVKRMLTCDTVTVTRRSDLTLTPTPLVSDITGVNCSLQIYTLFHSASYRPDQPSYDHRNVNSIELLPLYMLYMLLVQLKSSSIQFPIV